MIRVRARHFPLLIVLLALVAAWAWWLRVDEPTPEPPLAEREETAPELAGDEPAPTPPPEPGTASGVADGVLPPEPVAPPSPLSVLASVPDWSLLNAYQHTITRADFKRLLTEIFTTGEAWRGHIRVEEKQALIHTGLEGDERFFHLRFAPEGLEDAAPRSWRATSELPPASVARPLDGLHIAIDPGHIGGEWARMEERWFVVGDGEPVIEGDMTLKVARMMKPELEALGARVTLVREEAAPLTPLRPELLEETAAERLGDPDSPRAIRRFAERLFYRTAEIRARAERVNREIQPDLVLCLHFNAEAWGNPARPTLVERSHLHLLLNGGYTDDEVGLADQRHAMLLKLLQRTHEEEAHVGATVADVFAEVTGLPPFTYTAAAGIARQVNGHPYLWARNLLANRLYDSPVIYLEPYVMNSVTDHARIQAGDYEGLREVAGEMRPSIYREYVRATVEGLREHYLRHRVMLDAP